VASRPLPLPRSGPDASARRTPAWILPAGLLAVVAVTTLLAYDVKLGVALLVALCFVPIAFLQLPLAMCGWVVMVFFSRAPGLGGVANRLELLIIACWLGLLAGRRTHLRRRLAQHRTVLLAVVAFTVWVLMTLAWAPDSAVAARAVRDLLYGVTAFALLLGTIVERRHARWIMAAFVVGATLSVLWGAAKGGLSGAIGGPGAVTDQDGRFQSGAGDPNYLAAVLAPAIMLAGGLAFRRSSWQRLALAVAVSIIAIGLAATQSRGGLVAAIVASLVALTIWRGRRLLIVALLVIAVGATAVFFATSPSAWQRIYAGNSTGSGRIDIWRVAWRVANDHPFAGVGISQFSQVSPHYVRQPGALDYVDLIVDKHIVVHNLYLELWVETGIVGLLLFLTIVVASIREAWRAIKLFDAQGDSEMAALARTALLAIVGMLSASFFLSNVANRQIWILLALGPMLAEIARLRQAEAPVPLPTGVADEMDLAVELVS